MKISNNGRATTIAMVILSMMAVIFRYIPLPEAEAFSGAGEGDATHPFQISTCDQLQEIQTNLSANYLLSGNIDCTESATWNDGAGFLPIGFGSDNGFEGTFDGDNHSIIGLTINSSENYAGLFSFLSNSAAIQDVSLDGGNVSGAQVVGSLAGQITNNAQITNVSTSIPVSCVAQCGGLIGSMYDDATLTKAFATGDVTSPEGNMIGGIVGHTNNQPVISDVYATNNVVGDIYVGGLVGNIQNTGDGTTVQRGYSSGTVAANEFVGGIVGNMELGSLDSTFTTAQVTGETSGGLVGTLDNTVSVGYNVLDVTQSGQGICDSGDNNWCEKVNTTLVPNSTYFFNNHAQLPFNHWNFDSLWHTHATGLPTFAADTTPPDNSSEGDDGDDNGHDGTAAVDSSVGSSSGSTAHATTSSDATDTTATEEKILLDDFIEYAGSEGKTLDLTVGQVVYFMVDGEEHSATIKEIGADYIIITLASTPRDVKFIVGEVGQHDVTDDDVNDIQITLNHITAKTANLTFKRLIAEAQKTGKTVESETPLTTPVTPKTTNNFWVISGVVVVIPFGGVSLIIWKRRKK